MAAGEVIIVSGPIGAGKTAVAVELVPLWSKPLAYIEGDKFWPFLANKKDWDRREDFRVLMRSMTAAALPLARSGYDVLLDFSVPPGFLRAARRILRDVPLYYIVLRPSLAVCAARARSRKTGKITHYDQGFYALFEGAPRHTICGDEADPKSTAMQIRAGLAAGRFRVEPED